MDIDIVLFGSNCKQKNPSDFKQHSSWVFNMSLDSLQEQNCILTIKETMVIGQSQVHHRSGHNLAVPNNWALDNGVHAQNSTLGRVQNGGSHQWTESASVGNGEGSTLHIFDGDFSFFSFLGKLTHSLLKFVEFKSVSVSDNRNH